jgi:hypothetical protein
VSPLRALGRNELPPAKEPPDPRQHAHLAYRPRLDWLDRWHSAQYGVDLAHVYLAGGVFAVAIV